MTTPTTSRARARSCGACKLCCKLLNIPTEPEPAPVGTWCQHCDVTSLDKGCKIYDQPRPKGCEEFSCGWLEGCGPEMARPDKAGGFFKSETMPTGTDVSRFLNGGSLLILYLNRPRPTRVLLEMMDAFRHQGCAVAVVNARDGWRDERAHDLWPAYGSAADRMRRPQNRGPHRVALFDNSGLERKKST